MWTRRQVVLLLAAGISARAEVDTGEVEREIHEAVNRERQKAGRGRLAWDYRLVGVARSHSRNMAARAFFAHDDPTLGGLEARLAAAGIAWQNCGENLFLERGYVDPVAAAIEGWLKSPGHRKNMLSPVYTLTGVGAFVTLDGSLYISQEFIRPPVRKR